VCEVDAAALGLGAWALDLRSSSNRGDACEAATLVDPAAFAQRHAEAHW
jgi:hypothetical protein